MSALKCSAEFSADDVLRLFDCLDKKLSGKLSIDMLIRHLQWFKSQFGESKSKSNLNVVVSFFNSRPDLKNKIITQQLQPLFTADSNLFMKLKLEYNRMDINRSGLVSSVELIRYCSIN